MTQLTNCDVLLIEDDLAQCEEAAAYLVRSRLDVAVATNGQAALLKAALYRPRVALIDYNLPDTDGVQLARRLRAILPDLKIVIVSGRIEGLPQETLKEIGISAFVNKPVPLLPLRRGISRLLAAAA